MYSWKEYWDKVASSYGGADARGFAPVLHPGAPEWFNSTIDRLQEKSWQAGLEICGIQAGAQILDVGCGTGRWLRRYDQMQMRAVGLDATQDMLRRAIANGLKSPVVAAKAQKLPFRNGVFDLVSDVTVVQHIPAQEQIGVLEEMARILKPGGYLLLIELTRGIGPHIFPREPRDWIKNASSAGLKLIHWHGQEFLVFDQAFVKTALALRSLVGGRKSGALPAQAEEIANARESNTAGKAAYWGMRRITCKVSEWVEPLARRLCPARWATHAMFVFQKQGSTG